MRIFLIDKKQNKGKSIMISDVTSFFSSSRSVKSYDAEKSDLLNELIDITREVQSKYSGKAELASQNCKRWVKATNVSNSLSICL